MSAPESDSSNLRSREWISCKERLPEECECVLVYAERDFYDDDGLVGKKKVIDTGWQVDGKWHLDGCNGVVGIVFNSDGSESYNTVPHDYEDFKEIIDRYGTNWSTV